MEPERQHIAFELGHFFLRRKNLGLAQRAARAAYAVQRAFDGIGQRVVDPLLRNKPLLPPGNVFFRIGKFSDKFALAIPRHIRQLGARKQRRIHPFTRNGKRRMDILVGIAYSDSVDDGLTVLQKIAANEPRFLMDPAPQVMVASMGESSVNLQLRGWAKVDDYWDTFWDLNKQVKEEIEQAGLTIPFPQRSVHVVAGSGTMDVAEAGA